MKKLNQNFRNKNQTTDVLSFPAEQYAGQKMVGDLAISAKIARENARRLGHSFLDEIKILVLHGILHLAGYDHETDSGQMAAAEHKLRKRLHLPDSLIERSDTMKGAKAIIAKKKIMQTKSSPVAVLRKRGKKRPR